MSKRKTRTSSKSNNKWFIRVRGSYLPYSWQGWLTYVPYTAYLVGILVYAMSNTNNWLHAIPIVVPNWIVALIVMTWVAERRS